MSRSGAESEAGVGAVLENVGANVSRDLLVMLVEHMSGLADSSYVLEVIWERNVAVVTFGRAAGRRRRRPPCSFPPETWTLRRFRTPEL